MNRLSGIFCTIFIIGSICLNAQEYDYESSWDSIQQLENDGLPKSAVVIANEIFETSRAEKNNPQFIKSFIYKMKYKSMLDFENFAYSLNYAEKMADSVSSPVKQILHSMLGEMYWWYFQNNRYKFYNRSKTSKFVPDDISTWDLNQIVSRMLHHYNLSVQNIALKDVMISDYEDILEFDTDETIESELSLFDFLALKAVRFFMTDEPGIARPVNSFSINKEELFVPADSFALIKIQTSDSTDFSYSALIILQELIKQHLHDSIPDLLVEADLQRLTLLNQKSILANKDELYLKGLRWLELRSKGYECYAKVGLAIAEKLYTMGEKYNPQVSENFKWEKKKAFDLCQEIERSLTSGSHKLGQFRQKVLSKSIAITLEKENLPNEPFRALVSYRNVDSLYIRVVKTSFEEYEKLVKDYNTQRIDSHMEYNAFVVNFIKSKAIINQFTTILPTDNDFQTHYAEIKLPALEKGLYFIMAGNSPDFDYEQHSVNFGTTAITNISYINRRNANGSMDIYVLNRKTGEPMEGVKVRYMTQNNFNRNSEIKLLKEFITKKNEPIQISAGSNYGNGWLDFSFGDDVWSSRNMDQVYNFGNFYLYGNNSYRNKLTTRTFFFTDRSIYRPGQIIYFKGIIIDTDGDKKASLCIGKKSTVEFFDVNGQKVAETQLVTNEFGSFSGSFTAPSGVLNGEMSIEDDYGSIDILVEDYKRPKFEVKYDTLKASYKLGQNVTVKGYAKAYSGAKIDNAKVQFRVVRKLRYDWWHNYWWMPRPVSNDDEITNGTLTTDEKGAFEITFKALPDESISPSSNPVFTFEVYADVTDINGETHSANKRINAGYKALMINTDMPEYVEQNDTDIFNLTTSNQNGDFVKTTGKISVQMLVSPKAAYRERLWEKPDRHTITEKEYHLLFPNDQYSDELNPDTWNIQKLVLSTDFNTEASKSLNFPDLKKWETGMYKLTIEARDTFGEPVIHIQYFTLYNRNDKNLPYPKDNFFVPIKSLCEPGDKAAFMAGSGFGGKFNALFEIEANRKIENSSWIKTSDGQQTFSYIITEEHRGNIGINFVFVRNNRIYKNSLTIVVPFSNKKLDLAFETFRNKLQPGEKESWNLKVRGKDGEKVASEMVATLYDASLDAFKPHQYYLNLYPYYSPSLSWGTINTFRSTNLQHYSKKGNWFTTGYYPNNYAFNWYGFGYNMPLSSHFYKNAIKTHHKSTFTIVSSTAQKGTRIKGIVLDTSDDTPLPGVNILIRGTTHGTVSDINGKFEISSDSDTIEIQLSYIGYNTEKISLEGKGAISIIVKLAPDIRSLEEVVVVGYGVQKKMEVTGSVVSVTDQLQGRVAGIATISVGALPQPEEKVDLSTVQARTNLNETAFFYPHLQTDENGDVIINFTIPEALTRWKMLGLAHSKDLKTGIIRNELVTQKDLMVVPNAPRFFRESDTIAFTAKITSLADKNLNGSAQLMLFDATTMKPIDSLMNNANAQKQFQVEKGKSINLSWNLIIPQGIQAVTYRVVAKAGNFSDGEESALPVLTNRMLVTESMPLNVKGYQTKTFTLEKLVNNTSSTLTNHKLTLEFTSNPAWYAIQALPYLMEYPYECAEQTFSRFYANSIASHIVNSNPRIKQVFESWKNITPDALLSNLEKNQELKSLLLEETPWVINAKSESARKQNVALLFDLNKMSAEFDKALQKIKKQQLPGGAWGWFQGMQDDRYITQHIVCGMGKLDHLGVSEIRKNQEIWKMVTQAISYLDRMLVNDYENLLRLNKEGKINLLNNHISYSQIHFLYARSFFKDVEMSEPCKTAVNYYLSQARKYWLSQNIYLQGMLSLALHRNGDIKTPGMILKSLKENARTSEEMGMYWNNEAGWYWYQAPVETQAIMIEAFDEITKDAASVNEMKVWLLKQKQTQDWKTTRATVEACYALLLRGSNLLENDKPVEIKVGNQIIDPSRIPEVKVEAGTGYFKTSWTGGDIKPEMGTVTLTKKDNGVSWGALYWQYFEQLDKITPAETPLKLKKQLFMERITNAGPVIEPITDSTKLQPGHLIKVRIELRVDRTMEYVHMKDMRAAGLEPVNVISRYKYQDGLGYYESTRDAATNFFFGRLPKGTYVFEYPLRVTHYGNFSNGITTIQCMYAPEFSSHSEGVRVIVKGSSDNNY